MPDVSPIPFETMIFVCVHARSPEERVACGGPARCGEAFWSELKKQVAIRGWAERVRVSKSGCLDRCEEGPNAVVLRADAPPRWYKGLGPEDVPLILDTIQPRTLLK